MKLTFEQSLTKICLRLPHSKQIQTFRRGSYKTLSHYAKIDLIHWHLSQQNNQLNMAKRKGKEKKKHGPV